MISEINEAVNLGVENYDDWELILARLENRIDPANLISILRQHNLIDEAVYIGGTKIHANANKYSLFGEKIPFGILN